jgi:hypothetical protein
VVAAANLRDAIAATVGAPAPQGDRRRVPDAPEAMDSGKPVTVDA